MKLILLSLLVNYFLWRADSCVSNSFDNITISASDANHRMLEPRTVTGCIEALEELEAATTITVSHQKIQSLLHGAVSDLPLLKTLKAIYNGIESVESGAFVNLKKLEQLDLSYNLISLITAFDNLAIKKLSLNNNRIISISPDAFDNIPNLEEVDVRFNLLAEWDPNWFSGSPNVRYVNFAFNYIWELPEGAFKNLKGVHGTGNKRMYTKVYLMDNVIERLHKNSLLGMEYLGHLNLDSNKISSLEEEMFASFKYLYWLSANNNNLGCVPKTFYYPNNKTIHAVYNRNPLTKECLEKINTAKGEE